jgi:hypothetical protein
MNANWTIQRKSIPLWRNLVKDNWGKDIPNERREKNVCRKNIILSEKEIWHKIVGCQVTTIQRSGPESLVDVFLKSNSAALDLKRLRESNSVNRLFQRELLGAGLRRYNIISNNLTHIFNNLENSEWDILKQKLIKLKNETSPEKERAFIDYMTSENKYPGLGQKQSRNFIQWLGLSKYEIPIDSRTLKKLKEFGCNFVPTGSSLTDKTIYLFVQDCLIQISEKLDIYPCELDACIFSSFDT